MPIIEMNKIASLVSTLIVILNSFWEAFLQKISLTSGNSESSPLIIS